LNFKASHQNLPESRNFGFRINTTIVIDQILQEAQDLKLREAYQTSVFSKAKHSPRGIKNQHVRLEKTIGGGYRNTLNPEKFDFSLSKLLLKQNIEESYHYKNIEQLDMKKSQLADKMAPILPNPDIFHDNDRAIVHPHPEAIEQLGNITGGSSSKAFSIGRDTM
jgi:hypothetical protein